MLRSGFLLGVVGPAAMLTLLVLPSVRASADRLVQPQLPVLSNIAPQPAAALPGNRAVSLTISPIHGPAIPEASAPRPVAVTPTTLGPSASEKDLPKPRRMTREGCETPLSSLVGPEARRMVPGRCMA